MPAEANVVTARLTTPLYGDGLIEAIPDATILANVNLPKPNGVAGRASIVTDIATGATRVGRFGWKAQHATLLSFSGDALNNEVGVTNRLFPKAAAPNGDEARLARFVSPTDPIEDQPDPKTGLSEIDRLSNYLRLLAPPVATTPNAASLAGQKLFASVGCASCHTPSMNTGPNASAALANQTVALYSDLLLHDMGTLGDGIVQADAGAFRKCAPRALWGLHAPGSSTCTTAAPRPPPRRSPRDGTPVRAPAPRRPFRPSTLPSRMNCWPSWPRSSPHCLNRAA